MSTTTKKRWSLPAGKKQLKVYVPERAHDLARKQAAHEGISMSQLVTELIEGGCVDAAEE